MKKLITMIGAAAAAFGLYAVDLEPTATSAEATEMGYEGDVGTSVLEADESYWYMAESAADAAVVKAYGEETAPSHTALYAASSDAVESQNRYIGLDSEAPVYRTFAQINAELDPPKMNEVAIETADRGGIIADQLVKFSAFEDDPADLDDGAKIAVWVKTVQEENDTDPAINHLMISTAALDSDDFSPTLMNIDTEEPVDVANWHQLKITAIQATTVGNRAVPGFVVELDGKVIAKADGLFPATAPVTYTAQGAELIAAKKLFPSMIAYSVLDSGTLRGVAFKGTGAINKIEVAAADVYDPSPAPTYVAEIGGTGYETIEAAIEAVQDDETIKLLADLTTTVIVPAGKNFTLDFNGFGLTTNWGIQNFGTLTIVNGKINTIESSVVLYGGSVTTIESGTFTATDNAVITGQGLEQNNNVTLTINGGTFTGGITTEGYIACGVYVANSGTYAINGGTFNITNGCGICARAGQVTVDDAATFTVTGGSITGKVGDKNVAIPCVAMYIDYSEPPYPGYAETDFLKAEVNTLSIADGFEWAGPVDGLYTLQAKSTEVDPTVIVPTDITAGTKVSDIFKKVPSEFAAVDAKKFATWCQKEGNKSLVGEGGADAQLDAFLLDCLNSAEEIEKAKKEFVITSIKQDANGNWIVLVTGEKGQNDEYGNGYVNIIPATEIPAVKDVSAFFKAVLTIAPVQ